MVSNSQQEQLVEAQHEWLMIGAEEKARSVVQLAEGISISSILDIGAGTGAVLIHLDRLAFADKYYALEPSTTELAYLLDSVKPSRLVEAEATVLDASSFRTRHFDLAVLSHVLEHLDAPAKLLSAALNIADYVLVEVPLEGSVGGNVRAGAKKTITHRPRHNNSAGHVQFFSSGDIESLVHWCGGEIVRSRYYVPRYHPKTNSRLRRAYFGVTEKLSALVGNDLWSKLYYGHYAVLVRNRPEIPTDERKGWGSMYFYEGKVEQTAE